MVGFVRDKKLDLVAFADKRKAARGLGEMIMRALPVAATLFLGLTVGAAAQMLGPGMGFPGAGAGMPGFNSAPSAPPPQQRGEPPCFAEFTPLRAEAEKRANVLKAAMQKKVAREEACTHIKSFAAAEAKVVKFVATNAQTCGIPPQAVAQMKSNHDKTMKAQTQLCSAAAGPAKPSGPGLSEALGTARGGTLDPLAPQSGGLDTLTGNVLTN